MLRWTALPCRMHAHSHQKSPSFWRTMLVCGTCFYVAHVAGADAAAFPFVITAFASPVGGKREAKRLALQLLSHLTSAMVAVIFGILATCGASIGSSVTHAG